MALCAGSARLARTARAIRAGAVVAYPTEAVWGLGCDPYNHAAVQRILDLKQRPVEKGLIMIAAHLEQCEELLQGLPDSWLQRIAQPMPKPTTWLIPNNGCVPFWITGDHASFALRITRHPYAKQLCELVGGPIVSTSANPAGKPEAKNRVTLRQYFPMGIDDIAPGIIGASGSPSEIVDIKTGAVLRAAR